MALSISVGIVFSCSVQLISLIGLHGDSYDSHDWKLGLEAGLYSAVNSHSRRRDLDRFFRDSHKRISVAPFKISEGCLMNSHDGVKLHGGERELRVVISNGFVSDGYGRSGSLPGRDICGARRRTRDDLVVVNSMLVGICHGAKGLD